MTILIMLTVAVSASMTNTGAFDDPYEIRTAEDLFRFAEQVNTVEGRNNINGKLMTDINLTPAIPCGTLPVKYSDGVYIV